MEAIVPAHSNPKLIHFNIGRGGYKTCMCPCKKCITGDNQCICKKCGCWDDSEPPRNHPRGITDPPPKVSLTRPGERHCNDLGCENPVVRTSSRGRWPLKCPLHKK